MLIFRLFAVLALILLNGCASSPEKQKEPVMPAATKLSIKNELPKRSEAKTEIDQDVLFMLMSAEIAGQDIDREEGKDPGPTKKGLAVSPAMG